MEFFGLFSKRIEITIDDTNVDSDLTNFPVMIALGTSVGQGSTDVSCVFDELTSDANRKKIAVTTSDGKTQCYVEIAYWSDADEKAELWVKVPSILASGGATLYLYYDSTSPDNTTYVGDVGSTPGQAVWDSNFVAVYHLSEDPNGDPSGGILDSTSNGNNGTPAGSMTTADLVNGLGSGKALDFDGSNDMVDIGTDASLALGAANHSLEAWTKHTAGANAAGIIALGHSSFTEYGLTLGYNNAAKAGYIVGATWRYNFGVIGGGAWHYVAGTWVQATSTAVCYVDGASESFSSGGANAGSYNAIGEGYNGAKFTGIIDEVRISNITRPGAWIKASYYSGKDDLISFGVENAWLSEDWAKRIKLTISCANVDAAQTNFPVMIFLSASSGITSADVSGVFDELTSDANRFKIAVTTDDGVTQCYVEIENWLDASELAQLWVKVPSISDTVDTVLYLYYEADVADNTTYVGDTGGTVAQSVWDANHILVYHLNQDPSAGGACILDSTSNNRDGTPAGTMLTGDLVAGPYGGKAIDFDGTDDEINFTIVTDTTLTVELFIKQDNEGTLDIFCGKDGATTDYIANQASGGLIRTKANNTDADVSYDMTAVLDAYKSIAIIMDGTNVRLMVDGASINTAAQIQEIDIDTLAFGSDTSDYHIDAEIAEFRISDLARSQAWVKAGHYSNTDAIITFSAAEIYAASAVVALTDPLAVTVAVAGTPILRTRVILTDPLQMTVALSIESARFHITLAEALNIGLAISATMTIIGRDLWNFNSYITRVLSLDSPIEKISSWDSRITRTLDLDSSVR